MTQVLLKLDNLCTEHTIKIRREKSWILRHPIQENHKNKHIPTQHTIHKDCKVMTKSMVNALFKDRKTKKKKKKKKQPSAETKMSITAII